jgi:CheY-like chemotaxis protein
MVRSLAERRETVAEAGEPAGHSVLRRGSSGQPRLLAQALRGAGAGAAFGAAKEAFATLDRVRPSVIVADIACRMNGYTFIRRVRACALRRSSPCGDRGDHYATTADRAEALTVGFQRHLPKPIDPGRLVQAIYELTRRS